MSLTFPASLAATPSPGRTKWLASSWSLRYMMSSREKLPSWMTLHIPRCLVHLTPSLNRRPAGKAPANKPQQRQQTQVQQNTAIKGKGPNPQYSEQQSADSGSSQQKKEWPFRHRGKGKGAHNHVAGAPDTYNSNFILALAVMHIANTPALPAPTAHSVTSFSAAGPSTWWEKAMGPWKNPGRTTPPYPHIQCSCDLMSCLGVTPTIQTSKEFEGITSLEEVTDGTFGAPTVNLGAYMLQEPESEAPTFHWGAYTLTEPHCEHPGFQCQKWHQCWMWW